MHACAPPGDPGGGGATTERAHIRHTLDELRDRRLTRLAPVVPAARGRARDDTGRHDVLHTPNTRTNGVFKTI